MAGRRAARRPGARRVGAVTAAAGLLLAAGAGYAVADAADVVPGVLTTDPVPVAPQLPPAPGALLAPRAPDALPDLAAAAPEPDPAVLATSLGPLLRAPALGGAVGGSVVDATTGRVLLDDGAATAREPASVAKLLTAAAVLERLGPDATLPTRVVAGAAPGQVVLVGGGDVLLAAGAGDPAAAAGRAGLADLADATAQALRERGTGAVVLAVDDSLTGGAPAVPPGWHPGDLSSGYAAPVTSLGVDAGRLSPGRPPGRYGPRSADPALSAASAFAALLAERGVAVQGAPARTSGPVAADAEELAEVRSAPLREVVEHVLAESDNTAAEALASVVAADAGRPSGPGESAAAVLAEVAALGVDTSATALADGSGLGDGSRVPPAVLSGVLAAAAGPDHPRVRPLLAALPVAGLTGTLAERFTGADGAPPPVGAGAVRAKTGSLTGVTSLAGTVVDADGRLLAFAVLADATGPTGPARAAVDAVADALARCGCR
ncbi:D-alanyl-D-alanine carboxypeptidase/D-alanyl-D-alanine-endopeptidase [Quadrisphaera sp. DSM 44207]|uniref:D-alanyl-D-alanine carboxypeptidase/D-alanyl-D-alanine endopeptidase n=1 Tax=Quadrisphaera sp. DSM 44207 TaxID=1881057 RepID=UPI0008887C20|nr:D-alanyl-D-alanine carboxypeptidase/D-alanyl-D-alanine-endopeptidase [Quadrisphaera sp. DSM 44207]SDQ17024.1 D-alanyl-D-alanine carboxypeptidase / D-alanyl-D-alanine-endopeptidase (penicillin-binding protein 4) [Quadrisphaera sp. DSM 44207]